MGFEQKMGGGVEEPVAGSASMDAAKEAMAGAERKEELKNVVASRVEEIALENRMAAWTAKQKAAFEYLKSINSNWSDMLNKENLTSSKLDTVEKFANDPSSIIKSASYNESTSKFEATGKVEVNAISGGESFT